MSNSFTQKNVAIFLAENGASEETALFVSDFVVVAVRTTSSGAEIKSQEFDANTGAYKAVLAGGVDDINLAYAARKLGAGFLEHVVTVTCGDQTYGLNRLIHSPLDVADLAPDPVVDDVPAEEVEVPQAAVEPVDVPVVEVADVAPEQIVEEVSTETTEEAAPAEAAPTKKKKAKKAE